MPGQVLDSSGLLIYLRDEPGADSVQVILEKASHKDTTVHMAEATYAEVKCAVLRVNGEGAWKEVERSIDVLPIEFHPDTRQISDAAGEAMAHYRVILADAFAAALAQLRNAQLVTANPGFKAAEGKIKILWLR